MAWGEGYPSQAVCDSLQGTQAFFLAARLMVEGGVSFWLCVCCGAKSWSRVLALHRAKSRLVQNNAFKLIAVGSNFSVGIYLDTEVSD
jgi:hypothetical protein